MMNTKINRKTRPSLASLFILLMKEGVTPDQIMVGIVQLATDTQDLEGMIASADCLRCLLGTLPVDIDAKGIIDFVSSLGVEGVTTLALLDALGIACYQCSHRQAAGIIRLAYQKLVADNFLGQLLNN